MRSEKIRYERERRHLSDQARPRRDILQLIATLNNIAVGSCQEHQDIFQKRFIKEEKLDHDQQRKNPDQSSVVPLIFGRIDDPETGSLDRTGKPYDCPVGWTRYAIKVIATQEEFDRRYVAYHVAYHGTKSSVASNILNNGLRGSHGGCHCQGLNIYLSPSTEYSAHPRYAKPWKNPKTINTIKCNSELEWVLPADEPISLNDLICYGIMLRITDGDPADLTFMQMVGIFSQYQLLIVLYTIYRYIKKFCT
ncbi:unnamed protein product [Rotaria sp. Silwood2]|nr:unnamed protein product [Rotaria sp. Silwood2]